MKKTLVVGIILVVIVVVSLVSFLPFGSNGKAKELDITEDFNQIEIKTENAEVEIVPSDRDTTIVELTGNKNNKYKLVANVEEDSLNIKVKDRLFSWFSINLFNWSPPSLKVYVPKKSYDSLNIVTDNGKVEAKELQANEVFAETDNGRITLKHIQSSAITTEADNGKISLENVEGLISAKSNNGHISLITDSLDRSMQMETDNGSIDIQTQAEPTNVTFDLNVNNGKISVFGDSDYDTVIGKGDNLIKLTTDNGKITVH